MLVFYLATSMCGLSVKTVQCLVYSSGVVYKGLKNPQENFEFFFLKNYNILLNLYELCKQHDQFPRKVSQSCICFTKKC